MSDKTGISWTDTTWNPIRGCVHADHGPGEQLQTPGGDWMQLAGIRVVLSHLVPLTTSRGHQCMGFRTSDTLYVTPLGWKVFTETDEEARDLLMWLAVFRDQLHDERNQLEPFASTLEAFGCWL